MASQAGQMARLRESEDKTEGIGMRVIRLVGLLCTWLVLALPAFAGESRFSVLLDIDNNAATGCTVGTVSGTVSGIELVATTVVTTSSSGAVVTRLERQQCSGGALGAVVVYDGGGWPVGLGNGTGGTAAIETSIPLALLPASGTIKAQAIASAGGGTDDATASFSIALVSGESALVVPVPLSRWLALPLSLLLVGAMAWWHRRYPAQRGLLVLVPLVLVAASGLAWAASVVRDGNVGDWAGLNPVVVDAAGDAAVNADIVAVFAQKDTTNLFFRIDADVRSDAATNQAPVVSAGANQSIALSAVANLSGSASDDGLPSPAHLTTAWSTVTGPAGGSVLFGNASQLVTTASFTAPGSYALRLSADDGALIGRSDVVITVGDAGPKLVPIGDRTISLGTRLRLQVVADDANVVDHLTYTLVSGPPGASLNPSPTVDWTPSDQQLGGHSFTVRVSDGVGHTDQASFQVTVTNTNRPPQFAEQAAAALPRGATFARTLTATDPDPGDVLTYSLVSGPTGMTLTGANLSWPTGASTPGDYPVTVKVIDAGGLFDVRRFVVTVMTAAAPVSNPDSYSVKLGQTLVVNALQGVLVNDIDPMGGTLTAQKLTDPDKGSLTTFGNDGGFTYQAPSVIGQTFQPVVKWISHSGIAGDGGYANPRAIDVDGDGKPEIIVHRSGGAAAGTSRLVVMRGSDGVELWRSGVFLPVPNDTCTYLPGQTPDDWAVADIDDSGQPAIVLSVQCTDSNVTERMVALDARTGTFKWITPALSPTFTGAALGMTIGVTPAIARLRAGEKPSVLFKRTVSGWDSANRQYCDAFQAGLTGACTVVMALDGATGGLRQTWVAAGDNEVAYWAEGGGREAWGHVAVADLTAGGKSQIVAGTAVWDVDGTLISNRLPGRGVLGLALANLDDSGQTAIVSYEIAGGYATHLVARKADGTVLWESPGETDTVHGHLTVADTDGDGKPNILVHANEALSVYNERGEVVWRHSFYDGTGTRQLGEYARPVVFDLDGDGVPEIIMQTAYGIEFFDGRTGASKANVTYASLGYPQTTYGPSNRTTPLVVDIDGDGHAEVVFDIQPSTYPLDSWLVALKAQNDDWQPARPVWTQYAMHDANVTDSGHLPYPEANNFAAPATNVYANPARIAAPVDPRKREQASFTYQAQADGLASNVATVNIDLLPPNRPPAFTSTPPRAYLHFGYDGSNPFVYQAYAVDPDVGDTLTYSIILRGGPDTSDPNCRIGASTGKLQCNILNGGSGNFADAQPDELVIAVTDSFGESAYQNIRLMPSDSLATVPGVIGQSLTSAGTALAAAGFVVGKVTEVNDVAAVGLVTAQFPTTGASVPKGEWVGLTVSKGPLPVAVPLVVGQAFSAASTLLAAPGFTVVVNRVFSGSDTLNTVLAQSVPAGTLLAPDAAHSITLTVSAGNGLRLAVDRSIATADQTITLTPAAVDVNGAPVALPALTYTIAPLLLPYVGPLPTVAGDVITAGAGTQGAFRVTANDSVNGRTASADFVVLPPPEPGGVTHGQAYAQMATALDAIFALKPQLVEARAASDTVQMKALLQQMVTLWRTVDVDDLKLSMPLVTADQFAPSLADLSALGLSATTDDVLNRQILRDAADDLRAWTNGLKTPGTTMAQLRALADQFATRAARVDGMVVSEYGGIYSQREYTRLLSHRIPAFYDALFTEIALQVGMAPIEPGFPGLKHMKATLAEQLTTIAVDYVVEKIMDEGSKIYKNAKKFALDTMKQVIWTAATVAFNSHLKAYVSGGDVFEVVSGASLSFRVFNEPLANQAIIEVPGDFDDPELTAVMIVGPDTVAALGNAIQDLFQKMKDGFSYGLDPKNNPKKYKNGNEAKKHLKEFKGKLDAIKQSVTNLQDTVDNVYQTADDVMPGCVFTSDPSCMQLIYNEGFKPVYRYTPPPGFASLGGLPVPIVFIVQNQYTGLMYFGTPLFMPAPKLP